MPFFQRALFIQIPAVMEWSSENELRHHGLLPGYFRDLMSRWQRLVGVAPQDWVPEGMGLTEATEVMGRWFEETVGPKWLPKANVVFVDPLDPVPTLYAFRRKHDLDFGRCVVLCEDDASMSYLNAAGFSRREDLEYRVRLR